MASVGTEYRIFNDDIARSQKPLPFNENKTFTQFPRLPTEIRHEIWRYCLPSRRYIALCVSDPRPIPNRRSDASAEYYTKRNALGNTISGLPYQLRVLQFTQWSCALLEVNHEAHHVFKTHYRVPLPLQPAAFSILHINPETDILKIYRDDPDGIHCLIALIHDILAYDPHGIGISHLAIGRNVTDLGQLAGLEPSEIDASVVQALFNSSFQERSDVLRIYSISARRPHFDGSLLSATSATSSQPLGADCSTWGKAARCLLQRTQKRSSSN